MLRSFRVPVFSLLPALRDFVPLVFGTGLRISCDPFEEELGDRENEDTLLCFIVLAQDPLGVGESSIIASIRFSLGEEEGMLLPAKVSWGSEMSSIRVTTFMMISPSFTFKILKWLFFVTSFSPCTGTFPFSYCGSFGLGFEDAIFLPFFTCFQPSS